MYHLGAPVGLVADKKSILLNLFFKAFRQAFTYFNNRSIGNENNQVWTKSPNKEPSLNKAFNAIYFEKKYFDIENNLKQDIIDANVLIQEDTTFQKQLTSFLTGCSSIFSSFKAVSILNDIDFKDHEKMEKLKQQHSDIALDAVSTFARTDRPIICWYNSEKKELVLFAMI